MPKHTAHRNAISECCNRESNAAIISVAEDIKTGPELQRSGCTRSRTAASVTDPNLVLIGGGGAPPPARSLCRH
jgi:hypothetical protein